MLVMYINQQISSFLHYGIWVDKDLYGIIFFKLESMYLYHLLILLSTPKCLHTKMTDNETTSN